MSVRFLEPGQTEHVRQVINRDTEFKLAARFLTRNMLLKVGNADCLLNLGHFPMSENYPLFKKYLMPVLDEIAQA